MQLAMQLAMQLETEQYLERESVRKLRDGEFEWGEMAGGKELVWRNDQGQTLGTIPPTELKLIKTVYCSAGAGVKAPPKTNGDARTARSTRSIPVTSDD